jgi:ribosomal RNA assembly protein
LSFTQRIKIPLERVGVLVGKGGSVKERIEHVCNVNLQVDSKTGEVTVVMRGNLENSNPFKAIEIVNAIARGFSPERAFRLVDEETMLEIIDLKQYAGKSKSSLERIKGRIIGQQGKARRNIEELTGAFISVYGHTVAIIGTVDEVRLASEAIKMLASGSMHKTVYNMLQRARSRAKMERLKLWEEREEIG